MPVDGARVAVIELEHSGHRLFFATLLANHLVSAGASCVLVTSPDSAQSPQGLEHFAYLDSRVSVQLWPRSLSLRSCVEEYIWDQDWTIALDGEGLVYRHRLPQLDATRLICLMLHSPDLYPVKPRQTRFLKRALLERARRRGYRILQLASPSVVLGGSQQIAPDPSPFALLSSSSDSQVPSDLDPQYTWIGLFGGIDQRKGPRPLIEAVKQSGRSDLALLIVGRWSENQLRDLVINEAAQANVTTRTINEYVPTQALRRYMQAVDYIAVLNSNEGSSGVFLAACALRKPVILGGSNSLLLDSRATGCDWEGSSRKALSNYLAKLDSCSQPSPNYRPSDDGQDFTDSFIRIIGE